MLNRLTLLPLLLAAAPAFAQGPPDAAPTSDGERRARLEADPDYQRELAAILYEPIYDRIGEPLPAFYLETLDGRQLERADLLGRRHLLFFWSPLHQACLDAFPALNALKAELAGSDIEFLAITDEDSTVVRQYLDTYDFTWPQATGSPALGKELGIKSTSKLVLSNRRGEIQAVLPKVKWDDEMSAAEWRAALAEALRH